MEIHLLTTKEVVSTATRFIRANLPESEHPCIYFFIIDGEVVYVGKTMNLWLRLRHHLANKFPAHYLNYLEFSGSSEKSLADREGLYIAHFVPYYNNSFNPWDIMVSDTLLRKFLIRQGITVSVKELNQFRRAIDWITYRGRKYYLKSKVLDYYQTIHYA